MKRLFLAAIVAAADVGAGKLSIGSHWANSQNSIPARWATPQCDVCLYAESTAGTFTVGKKTVPLVNRVDPERRHRSRLKRF